MNTKSLNKRWSVVRAKSGSVLRSFTSRESARNYRRATPVRTRLFDNVNMSFAR